MCLWHVESYKECALKYSNPYNQAGAFPKGSLYTREAESCFVMKRTTPIKSDEKGDTAMTPMMEQYWEIKKQYMDYIVFYRLGDFYEMFFDDAILASR